MPLAEWERQVREMLGYDKPIDIPGLPAPALGLLGVPNPTPDVAAFLFD
jgi:hypothetical protein